MRSLPGQLAIWCLPLVLSTQITCAQSLEVLHSFTGSDGRNPWAALVQALDGYLYGTTFNGGDGWGTVFRTTLSGVLSTVASFDYSNGCQVSAALTAGSDGNLYGVAAYGGLATDYAGYCCGDGTVFKVTTNGLLTTLIYFGRTNGAYPSAELIEGGDGKLYGGTADGGPYHDGIFFSVSRAGHLATLLNIDARRGRDPNGPFIVAVDGSFYGSTVWGGPSNEISPYGSGTIFRVTTNGDLTMLAAFDGTTGRPYNLILADDGNFYGTTLYPDTVFKMTPDGHLSVLAWLGGWYGENAEGGLVQASDHFLYGTARLGGPYGSGTVFRISTNGVIENVVSFDGTNGASPMSRLIQASDGNLYGTTYFGGVSNLGTVFRIVFARLTAARIQDQTVLSWPTNQIGYRLQYSDGLNPPNWQDCATRPVISGTQFVVTNNASNRSRFFRLNK